MVRARDNARDLWLNPAGRTRNAPESPLYWYLISHSQRRHDLRIGRRGCCLTRSTIISRRPPFRPPCSRECRVAYVVQRQSERIQACWQQPLPGAHTCSRLALIEPASSTYLLRIRRTLFSHQEQACSLSVAIVGFLCPNPSPEKICLALSLKLHEEMIAPRPRVGPFTWICRLVLCGRISA